LEKENTPVPYIKIETNKKLNDAAGQELLKKTSNFIATMLGKPEQYVMVSLRMGTPMIFAGTGELTAFVEMKSIGLPRDKCAEYAKEIGEFVEAELAIPPNRCYIDFADIDRTMFGWNRGPF
jgi:phenylpyruvate tautomerase PptA (4-oxalocrotonate tautomerase family)